MKFYCNSEELANAINIVSKALDNKKGIPILEGIKISAYGTSITLYSTDLELYIEKKINAEILIEGDVVVPGRFFADFVKKLTSFERIELEKLNDNVLSIKYGEAINEIKCLEDDFPQAEKVSGNNVFEIEEKELKASIEKSIFCVAIDGTRPIIKGCLIEVRDNSVFSVALDGYRLAKIKKPIVKKSGDFKMVIPGRVLGEIGRIIEEKDGIIKVYKGEKNVTFDMNHTKITAQLIEGDFIEYNKIIPEHYETKVNVKIEEFLDSLDRISVIARGKAKSQAKFKIGDNKINIFSQSDISTGKECISAKTEGKEIEIAFNCRYVYEALAKITGDYAEISLNNNNTPAKIGEMGSDESVYIVLPVRLI